MVLFIRMLFLCLISKNRCLSIEGSIDSNIWRQTPSFICSIWRVSTSMWASTETNRNFFSLLFFYLFIWLFIYFFHFFIWNLFHFRRWFCRTIQYESVVDFYMPSFFKWFWSVETKIFCVESISSSKRCEKFAMQCTLHKISIQNCLIYYPSAVCVGMCMCEARFNANCMYWLWP